MITITGTTCRVSNSNVETSHVNQLIQKLEDAIQNKVSSPYPILEDLEDLVAGIIPATSPAREAAEAAVAKYSRYAFAA